MRVLYTETGGTLPPAMSVGKEVKGSDTGPGGVCIYILYAPKCVSEVVGV